MTANQQTALRQLKDVGFWHMPPACAGQIVERTYGASEDFIFLRTHDRSDGEISVKAWKHPIGCPPFEPWNGRPQVGRWVGEIYRGNDDPTNG